MPIRLAPNCRHRFGRIQGLSDRPAGPWACRRLFGGPAGPWACRRPSAASIEAVGSFQRLFSLLVPFTGWRSSFVWTGQHHTRSNRNFLHKGPIPPDVTTYIWRCCGTSPPESTYMHACASHMEGSVLIFIYLTLTLNLRILLQFYQCLTFPPIVVSRAMVRILSI